MIAKHYVWQNNQVICADISQTSSAKQQALFGLYCVDISQVLVSQRYGMYKSAGWVHVPTSAFPPKFRVQLLLLGVPT